MRNKAPLALIEQLVMLLVFALAAALCIQVFVKADRLSQRDAAQSHAVLTAQNAAETLKSTEGDYAAAAAAYGGVWDGEVWVLEVPEATGCRVEVTPAAQTRPLLGEATVTAYTADDEVLVQLPVAWQEENGDA
jgi:type II secretory pathway pseudopilin PulG